MALTMAIVAINGWNRISIGFRAVPGTYQPKAAHTPRAGGNMKVFVAGATGAIGTPVASRCSFRPAIKLPG